MACIHTLFKSTYTPSAIYTITDCYRQQTSTLDEIMIPISIAPAPGALPFLGLLMSILTWVIVKWPIHRKSNTPQMQQPEKEPFVKPLPSPHPDDPTSNNPKLYRPFRHGPNFITMGIRKLHWDNWIEMDSYFLRYHDMKAAELKKDFKEHIKCR